MSSTSRRSQLLRYLRLSFFTNLILFFAVLCFWFYTRWQRSKIVEVSERLFAHNLSLAANLSLAHDVITNRVFAYSRSFASNVWVSAYCYVVSNSFLSSSSLSPDSSLPSQPSSEIELPPLDFSGYFEIDGIPHIRLRNTFYKKCDFVLGYPIEDISPDVVQYRGKFFKVVEK